MVRGLDCKTRVTVEARVQNLARRKDFFSVFQENLEDDSEGQPPKCLRDNITNQFLLSLMRNNGVVIKQVPN